MARIDDFKARFPNFDLTVIDTYFIVIENLAGCYYGGDYDNACDKEAFLLLYAHLLTLESNSSAESIRNQSSKAVGSVSVSYEASQYPTGSLGWFNTTKYGQQFVYLTSKSRGAVFV